jgi:hypothetical protein
MQLEDYAGGKLSKFTCFLAIDSSRRAPEFSRQVALGRKLDTFKDYDNQFVYACISRWQYAR